MPFPGILTLTKFFFIWSANIAKIYSKHSFDPENTRHTIDLTFNWKQYCPIWQFFVIWLILKYWSLVHFVLLTFKLFYFCQFWILLNHEQQVATFQDQLSLLEEHTLLQIILIIFLWKAVYPQCALLSRGPSFQHDMLPSCWDAIWRSLLIKYYLQSYFTLQ